MTDFDIEREARELADKMEYRSMTPSIEAALRRAFATGAEQMRERAEKRARNFFPYTFIGENANTYHRAQAYAQERIANAIAALSIVDKTDPA